MQRQLRYTAIGDSDIITLDNFVDYARISDMVNKDNIIAILRDATLRIAEYADVALLPVTIEIEGSGIEARLYEFPITQVTSVVDGELNDIKGQCRVSGGKVLLPYGTDYKITYTCTPVAATVQRFAPFVYDMASAIYDGDTEAQNKVYQRMPVII